MHVPGSIGETTSSLLKGPQYGFRCAPVTRPEDEHPSHPGSPALAQHQGHSRLSETFLSLCLLLCCPQSSQDFYFQVLALKSQINIQIYKCNTQHPLQTSFLIRDSEFPGRREKYHHWKAGVCHPPGPPGLTGWEERLKFP